MTQRAFPQLPNPQTLLTGPAQALANIERSFPIGPPPISLGGVLNQIAAGLPAPGATGIPGLPPLGPQTGILAALSAPAPRPPPRSPNGGTSPALLPAGRTGLG